MSLQMSIEAIIKESDSDFALRILSDITSDVNWSYRDRRDHTGTGYFQYFKNSSSYTPGQVLVVQELNEIGYYQNQQTESRHKFLVSVYSGEVGDDEKADILTTFGVDEHAGIIIAGQLINPSLDLSDPVVSSRLQSYELFGANTLDQETQWRALIDVLCPKPDDL